MLIIILLIGLFMTVVTFKFLENKGIGFDEYWIDGDRNLIWAIGAISMSAIWPVTLLILLFSFLIDKYIIVKKEKENS